MAIGGRSFALQFSRKSICGGTKELELKQSGGWSECTNIVEQEIVWKLEN